MTKKLYDKWNATEYTLTASTLSQIYDTLERYCLLGLGPYTLDLKTLVTKKGKIKLAVNITTKALGSVSPFRADVDPGFFKIGCATFSEYDFEEIVKRARAARRKAERAK